MEDIREDYEDVRQLHYESLRDRQYVSLETARARRLKLDFTNQFTPGTLFKYKLNNDNFILNSEFMFQSVRVSSESKCLRNTTWISWFLTLIGSHSSTFGS